MNLVLISVAVMSRKRGEESHAKNLHSAWQYAPRLYDLVVICAQTSSTMALGKLFDLPIVFGLPCSCEEEGSTEQALLAARLLPDVLIFNNLRSECSRVMQ